LFVFQYTQFNNLIEVIEDIQPKIIFISDINIKSFSLFNLLNANRNIAQIPIIITTNHYQQKQHIEYLDAGANDFISVKTSAALLTSRIKSLVQKTSIEPLTKDVFFDDIFINSTEHIVTKNGNSIHLLNREFKLLQFLASNQNIVFTREEILKRVLEKNLIIDTRSVDVHICKIKKKLGINNIKTITKIGYKFEL